MTCSESEEQLRVLLGQTGQGLGFREVPDRPGNDTDRLKSRRVGRANVSQCRVMVDSVQPFIDTTTRKEAERTDEACHIVIVDSSHNCPGFFDDAGMFEVCLDDDPPSPSVLVVHEAGIIKKSPSDKKSWRTNPYVFSDFLFRSKRSGLRNLGWKRAMAGGGRAQTADTGSTSTSSTGACNPSVRSTPSSLITKSALAARKRETAVPRRALGDAGLPDRSSEVKGVFSEVSTSDRLGWVFGVRARGGQRGPQRLETKPHLHQVLGLAVTSPQFLCADSHTACGMMYPSNKPTKTCLVDGLQSTSLEACSVRAESSQSPTQDGVTLVQRFSNPKAMCSFQTGTQPSSSTYSALSAALEEMSSGDIISDLRSVDSDYYRSQSSHRSSSVFCSTSSKAEPRRSSASRPGTAAMLATAKRVGSVTRIAGQKLQCSRVVALARYVLSQVSKTLGTLPPLLRRGGRA